MDTGQRVLEWAHQNGYDLQWIAEKISYPLEELSEALHQNRITKDLSETLFKHFGIRVLPTTRSQCS